ncbi:MAG: TonB-dependent receptor [Bacteroidales bacterium]|nr:TonB-dependent receptor [Bacteroidales bacterium]
MLKIYHKHFHHVRIVSLVAGLALIGTLAQAQTPDLSRKVTVIYSGATLEKVLQDLTQRYDIRFSYNPNNLPVDMKIEYSAREKALEDVIEDIFQQAGIQYSLVSGYLVLKTKNVGIEAEKPSRPEMYTLSGIIADSLSREVLIGAAVYIKETGTGALSNHYGFFSITQPAGVYTFEISYLGYSLQSRTLVLHGNATWNVNLNPIPFSVKQIIVSAVNKEEVLSNTRAAQSNIEAKAIQRHVAALGETDMLKSLDLQPGISFQSDGSSYFYVRGGNRDQNLILLDEAPIYNPSHLLGLFTPIIPEAVKHTEIYKADFPIQYGGRLSSIMDIRTCDGNMQRFSANVNVGLVSTRISLEGPLKKDASSCFLSIRRSTFGYFVKLLDPKVEDFHFTDLTTKFNVKLGKRDRLFLTFFSGRDVFLNKPAEVRNGLEWFNNALTLRWNHVYGNRLFSNTTFYSSKYDYSLYTNYDEKIGWNSDITSSNLKSEFIWYCNSRHKINFGINLGVYFFNPGNYKSPEGTYGNMRVSEVNSGEIVLYAGYNQKLTDWLTVNYGLRFSDWSNYGEAFSIVYDELYNPVSYNEYSKNERYYSKSMPEPRISLSLRTGHMSYIKASYNRTIQHINQINNSISPLNSLEVWLPSGPNIKPQSAHIINLGYIKIWPEKAVDISADVYYKKMNNQIGYTYHAEMLLNPYLEGEIRQGDGEAYGFEIMLKKTQGKITGQFGYAFTRSFLKIDGLNNNRRYSSHQDKPLDFSLSVDYKVKPRWMLNLNIVYTSGMVLSTPTGFYYYRGKQVPFYAWQNNDRLPDYRRIDLGSVWRLNRKEERFEHYITLSIYNLFAAKNYAFLNFNKIKDEEGKFYVPADTYIMDEQIVSYRYIYSMIPSITYSLKF